MVLLHVDFGTKSGIDNYLEFTSNNEHKKYTFKSTNPKNKKRLSNKINIWMKNGVNVKFMQ